MDARGRWTANVFIERVWRSLKHEDVYLRGYADGREGKARIGEYFAFYNEAASSGARLSGGDGRLARRRNAGDYGGQTAFSARKVEAAPSSSTKKTPLCYIVAQGD
jgi:hypothetical protein